LRRLHDIRVTGAAGDDGAARVGALPSARHSFDYRWKASDFRSVEIDDAPALGNPLDVFEPRSARDHGTGIAETARTNWEAFL